MARLRVSALCLGILVAAFASLTPPPPCSGYEKKAPSAALAAEIEDLLSEGLSRQTSLSQLNSRVTRARSLAPNDPVVDYSHGLVLMKRLQNDAAVASFQAALKLDPTYLPAQKALVRLRFARKETKPLLDDANSFAGVIGNSSAPWRDEQDRIAAAAFLGRVMGFLARPEVKLVQPAVLQKTEGSIKKSLGEDYVDDYRKGIAEFSREYDELKLKIDDQIAQKQELHQKKSEDKIARLKNRSDQADKKADSLRINKEEAKSKFDEEVKQIDENLERLEKQYDSLVVSADRIKGLIDQTRLEITRAQFELENRGQTDGEVRDSPSLNRLFEELNRYGLEYAELELQANDVLAGTGKVVQDRRELIEQYRKETGDIVRESKAVERYNEAVRKNSEKEKKQAKSANVATNLKARLNLPTTYFSIDYKAETARLLAQLGIGNDKTKESNEG